MKYPAVYVYKRTSDKGQELKYSIRSLENVKNWNGEVFVAGDTESWFSDEIKVIDTFVKSHQSHIDVENKLRAVIADDRVKDDFIYMNDDFYCVRPTEIDPSFDGELETVSTKNAWQKAKSDTKAYLESKGLGTRNYDTHTPLIFNKQKLLEILDIESPVRLQFRSLYGNLHKIGGKQYKDRKTYTRKLLKGPVISTRTYTDELNDLFPEKSRFEL